ncbi:hypothetical protein FHX75_111294 [Micromonospora palomenae]|uniref:DUF4177 domain-containing protein n=1 Tax=Micromonospora palomenae TaxID=1461247 RepID=A0A561WW98_9ACTN|nr:hypothetical protein [Micromonospora palomenae]TWG28143.1 hypothetical protein FHX75_111294 [Micromonospora palomenae]
MTKFAIFYVTRANYKAVELPNGEVKKAPTGQADLFMREWWEKNESEVLRKHLRSELEQWESQLRGWRAGSRVDEGKGRLYRGGPRMEVSFITLPNGQRETVERMRVDEAIKEAFTKLHPKPTPVDEELNKAYRQWETKASVNNVRSWSAGFVEDGRESEVDIGMPTAWSCGLPAKEIVQQLDLLAADGWKLVHVSEDRGIYRGADASTDSSPTTVRYMLQRTT